MLLKPNKIRLFWWNEIKIQGKAKENYGDLLGPYLVKKLSGKSVVFSRPNTFSLYDWISPIYVTVGSILSHVNAKCVVWGSGIISKSDTIGNAKFLAVRGPQTRQYLLEQGYDVPEVYGDPALLLPTFYNPQIKKLHKIGIVPHYNDYKQVKEQYQEDGNVFVIDLMTNDIEETTRDILKCERIISSSLHGIIVAHAYGIPAIWLKFSNRVFGDDIKFQDYFESVGIKPYMNAIKSEAMRLAVLDNLFEEHDVLPDKQHIETLCNGLLAVCPFKSTPI